MISGIAIAAKGKNPNIRVFAAEPKGFISLITIELVKGADDAWKSHTQGKLICNPSTNTVADGLRTNLGSLTWPIIRDKVERVIVVSEVTFPFYLVD